MQNLLSRRSGPTALVLTALAALVIGCGGGGGGGGSNGSDGSTNAGTTNSGTTNAGTTNAGSSSDAGGTGGTDGGAGSLPQDSVFYVETTPGSNPVTYDVKYTKEDGSGQGTYATGVSSDVAPASPDPSAAGKFVFAAKPAGSATYGIYRNSSVSTAGATTIVDPSRGLTEVRTIQVARDGSKVVYVAATSTSIDAPFRLYVVSTTAGSVPTLLDLAESAAISSDGLKVVYSKFPSGESDTELYVRFFADSSAIRLTSNSLFDDDPQFSKDGTKAVFSQQVSTSTQRQRLGIIDLSSKAVTNLDPVPAGYQVAPSFNFAANRVSFVVLGNAPGVSGVYTSDTSGANVTKVLASDDLRAATYWSTPTGRAGRPSLGLGFSRR